MCRSDDPLTTIGGVWEDRQTGVLKKLKTRRCKSLSSRLDVVDDLIPGRKLLTALWFQYQKCELCRQGAVPLF
jgi:hypothetical protein